jgi:RNA polymerase sigma-70 factor (ECF subfamily)
MNLLVSVDRDTAVDNSSKETSDSLLVSAAKAGDANAFVALSRRHSKKLLKMAYRITRNRQDAEDAVQEAFLKAFLHLDKFEGRSSFSSWFSTIAINSALMILRKRRTSLEIALDGAKSDYETARPWEPVDMTEDPESRCVRRERKERLSAAILRLRPCLRSVVEVQQAQDSSTEEIAETLGLSRSAVKSRLSRARTALRKSLVRR